MDEDQIRSLRRRLAAAEGRGRRGYGAVLRDQVVAVARAWVQGGGSRYALATSLGLSDATLRRWTKSTTSAARIRAVDVIEADDEHAGLVAVLPGGIRLEGLTIAHVVELVRRLR